jgi:hypothetical protein
VRLKSDNKGNNDNKNNNNNEAVQHSHLYIISKEGRKKTTTFHAARLTAEQ